MSPVREQEPEAVVDCSCLRYNLRLRQWMVAAWCRWFLRLVLQLALAQIRLADQTRPKIQEFLALPDRFQPELNGDLEIRWFRWLRRRAVLIRQASVLPEMSLPSAARIPDWHSAFWPLCGHR